MYFPNATLDKLKEHLPKFFLLAKNQEKDAHSTVEIILRFVILDMFNKELETYKHPKYLAPALNLGKYLNISEEKFKEIIELDYSDSRYFPATPEAIKLFEFLTYYN